MFICGLQALTLTLQLDSKYSENINKLFEHAYIIIADKEVYEYWYWSHQMQQFVKLHIMELNLYIYI